MPNEAISSIIALLKEGIRTGTTTPLVRAIRLVEDLPDMPQKSDVVNHVRRSLRSGSRLELDQAVKVLESVVEAEPRKTKGEQKAASDDTKKPKRGRRKSKAKKRSKRAR